MIGTLDDLLAAARKTSACVLEQTARRGRDCPPGIVAIRAGEARVICTVEIQSIDLVRTVVDIAAKGFDPDMLAVCLDAWTSRAPINPETGEPWVPGDVGRLGTFGTELGWTTETLIIHAVNRAGDLKTLHANYRREGGAIEWTDDERIETVGGAFATALVDAMLAPTATQRAGGLLRRRRRLPTRDELDETLAAGIRRRLPVHVSLLPA